MCFRGRYSGRGAKRHSRRRTCSTPNPQPQPPKARHEREGKPRDFGLIAHETGSELGSRCPESDPYNPKSVVARTSSNRYGQREYTPPGGVYSYEPRVRTGNESASQVRTLSLLPSMAEDNERGLVFKAHKLVCHSTLGWRVVKKKKKRPREPRDPSLLVREAFGLVRR